MRMSDEEIVKKRTAREILCVIEKVCFSEDFSQYRVDYGCNGERDYIIKWVNYHALKGTWLPASTTTAQVTS